MPDQQPAKEESGVSIVNTLSIVIVFGYMAWLPLWMFFPPTEAKPEVLAIINQMMGAWGYAFAAVVGYHLGSSRSTKEVAASNRDALAKMTDTVATAATTAATVATTAAAVAGVPVSPVAGTNGTTNGAAETAAWNDAVIKGTRAAFDDYLVKFPTGVHTVEARLRIGAMGDP